MEKPTIDKNEVIEAIMEEWWEDIKPADQERIIKEWLEDTGFELE